MTTTVDQTAVDTWLEQRRHCIGASEVAGLVGLNKWLSPVDIYMAKVHPVGRIDNEFIRAGHLLEPVILRMYAEESGKTVTPNEELFVHPQFPFIGATPDGFIEDGGLVEAKNTRRMIDEVDYSHYLQLVYQMGVLDRPYGALAYLCQGYSFRSFYFDANPELFQQLVEIVESFWLNHILPGIPPEPTTGSDVAKLVRSHIDGKVVEATAETAEVVNKLQIVRGTIARWEAEEEKLKGQLQCAMMDAERLTVGGETVVTWKKAKDGVGLDEKRLKAERPEIWSEYSRVREGSRRFLLRP